MIATAAVWPRRKPVGIEASVIVVAYVTTELLVVAVGAIAVTVASAVCPGTAGKVTTAFWPTVTEEISASAMLALTVMAEILAIVAKLDPELVEDVPLAAVALADSVVDDDDEPEPTVCPTDSPRAITTPAIGAVSVALARFVSSLARFWVFVVT